MFNNTINGMQCSECTQHMHKFVNYIKKRGTKRNTLRSLEGQDRQS